jgi:hypothetical protein
MLGEERILCAHGLALPTQFALFLYQGLGEHLLVELRNRLMVNGNLSFPGFDKVAFRLALKQIIAATGCATAELSPTVPYVDWLKPFSVGTDLAKRCPGRQRHIKATNR